MLSPRAIATLGIGSPTKVAVRLGLWPYMPEVQPVFRRSVPLRITPAQRRKIHASAAVAWGFDVSSSARVSIGASAFGDIQLAAHADANLSLSGQASGAIEFSQNATADAVDVVLEAILLAS